MRAQMTPRERVLAACRHEQPDRVPLQGYFTPEIAAQLKAHFGTDDICGPLGIDLRTAGPRHVGPPPRPGPGMPGLADSYDEFGVGYSAQSYRGGTYMEATELALARIETLEDVERYPWPSADDWDYSHLAEDCRALAPFAVCLGGAGIPDILNGVSRGRGMERVMIEIATGDPVGIAVIDRRVNYYYGLCRRALEAAGGAVDILCLGEDCGNQNGRMFSPQCFESFFVPRLKRFIDLAHEFGALAMLHSCGDTHEIMPTFIEMGLDILDAMQPEPAGMDLPRIRALHGDRLTFCGLISTQQTLPHGTPADVRAEVRERVALMGAGGGYICSPAHCIQPDTPVENVLALYSEALGVEL